MTSRLPPWPTLTGGAHARLISPAGPADAERIERALSGMTGAGFRVSCGEHVAGRRGFLAGSDAERLQDLHEAFADPDVDLVVATRGGYGTQRLLDRLDRDLLARSRALLLGCSDLTALHVVLGQDCGRPSLYASALVQQPAGSGDPLTALRDLSAWSLVADPDEPTYVLSRGGSVTGPLVGGNLAMLASAAGTPDALRPPPGALLLLEDVREAPYRIDRMLLQLARAGTFDTVAGLVLGQFTDCWGRPGDAGAIEVLSQWCDRLAVPVLGGVPVGHGPQHQAVPLGLPMRLQDGELRVARLSRS